MRYRQTYIVALLAAIALLGCEQRAAESDKPVAAEAKAAVVAAVEKVEDVDEAVEAELAQADAKPSFHYSPFRVDLQGHGEFDVITFKDVGLKRKDTSPEHPLLETIAESLSYSISESDLGYGPAMVGYDEKLTSPEAHLACGQNHLYVDVWKTGSGSFGYSLWSGCGEADNFAWHELDEPAVGDTLADQVEPLTKSITASISKAKQSKCFRKHC